MFLLKQIVIEDHQKKILDVSFSNSSKADRQYPFSTLILGENGTGKSFLLKTIADIFIFLDKKQALKSKPRFQYEKFCVVYFMNNHEYIIKRNSGREIICQQDGKDIDLHEIELPINVLAVAFMVNDKFLFVDSGKEKSDMYKYLGVRKTTNATYTSSVISNVLGSVTQIINNGLIKELNTVLSVLHFESFFDIVFCNNSKRKKENLKTVRVDCSSWDKNPFSEEYYQGDKIYNLINHKTIIPSCIIFYKNGMPIDFEECSSGEKHMIFAFAGIMNDISNDSLILIDEPEISLHPEWQIKYISLLKKVFEKYKGCHFILASHSHYLVSDLQGDTSSIVTLSRTNSLSPKAELLPFETYAWSAENIIYNVFGLRTTRNYYFESDLHKLLSMIQSNDDSMNNREEIIKLTEKLKRFIYNEEDPLFLIIKQAEGFLKCTQDV